MLTWGLKSPQHITPRSCEEEKGLQGHVATHCTLINSIHHVQGEFVLDLCSRCVFVVSAARQRATWW